MSGGRPNEDYWIYNAINVVKEKYGDVVSVNAKKKNLHKFGENLLVGTAQATIMNLPAGVTGETYVAANTITHASSANAGDTGTAQIQGHTISGTDLTYVDQAVTLTGQTKAALTTPLARVQRAVNSGASVLAGNVYVFEDDTLTAGVPDTDAKVHLIVIAAENQSQKAAASTASGEYLFITNIYGSVTDKAAAYADIRLQLRTLGGVFQTKFDYGIHSQGASLDKHWVPYLIVPPNTDILMTAEADGVSTPITGGWNSVYAQVQS